jgi:hypothetical protein
MKHRNQRLPGTQIRGPGSRPLSGGAALPLRCRPVFQGRGFCRAVTSKTRRATYTDSKIAIAQATHGEKLPLCVREDPDPRKSQ